MSSPAMRNERDNVMNRRSITTLIALFLTATISIGWAREPTAEADKKASFRRFIVLAGAEA